MNFHKMTLQEKGVNMDRFITIDKLTSILTLHRMSGNIESGYRYWIMDFFGVFIKEHYLSSYLNELIQHSDKPCTGIIEKNSTDITIQIPILAQRIKSLHLLNVQGNL